MKLALAVGTTVLAVAGLEVGFRVRAHLHNRETLAAGLAELSPPSDDPEAGIGNIARLSSNDRIIYELQPNLVDRWFSRATVSTNRLGFRSAATTPAPEVGDGGPDTVTVVGIGDSIMFGHGVGDDEPFMAVLDRLLDRTYPKKRWRVINTAVPGYNTVMEVETLRRKGLQFRPDLVVLSVVGNDFAPPRFVRAEEDVFALDRSFLLDFLRQRGRAAEEPDVAALKRDGGRALIKSGREWWETDGESGPRVPERYRKVFGREAFAAALDELAALGEEHGFDVLVFATYDFGNVTTMLEEASRRGFPCIDLTSEIVAWVEEHSGAEFSERRYRQSALSVSFHNGHPSALQHRMAAERLLRGMEELGLVERYLAKP